jgi:2'-5' RNA ligase superfamily
MPKSSIDIHFNSLTPLLHRWRTESVAVANLGVPPHITLLYPWRDAPLSGDDLEQLRTVLLKHRAFSLCIDRLESFEVGAIYLALQDGRSCKAIMSDLMKDFPDTPPYGGDFLDAVPHLTIAKCDPKNLQVLKAEIARELTLPLEFSVDEIAVMEEDTGGNWFTRCVIPLRSSSM